METNIIQLFTNQLFGNIRSITINGEPWFVGSDVAICLGYEKPRNAIEAHVDLEDKIGGRPELGTPPITFIDSLGRQQTQYPIWINESGLYSLIFGSKLPAAKEFKHWVTSEVLPTMRKIGFNRSIQVLTEENMKLKQIQQSYEYNSYSSSMREAYITSEYNAIKENIINSELPEETKEFLLNHRKEI